MIQFVLFALHMFMCRSRRETIYSEQCEQKNLFINYLSCFIYTYGKIGKTINLTMQSRVRGHFVVLLLKENIFFKHNKYFQKCVIVS